MLRAQNEAGAELLTFPVRRRIVDFLANLPLDPPVDGVAPAPAPAPTSGLSAAALAEVLGLHVTTVRFHLDRLVTAGILDSHVQRHKGAGRPKKLYGVRPGSMSGATTHEAFETLADLLVDTWGGSGDGTRLTPEQAGQRWAGTHVGDAATAAQPAASTPGQFLGKVGRVVDALAEWGYTPELRTEHGGRTALITLVDCPFLDLARAHPDVVCGVHRGLLRGAMAAYGEDQTQVGLEPFVGPNLCVARLSTRTRFERPMAPPALPLPAEEHRS